MVSEMHPAITEVINECAEAVATALKEKKYNPSSDPGQARAKRIAQDALKELFGKMNSLEKGIAAVLFAPQDDKRDDALTKLEKLAERARGEDQQTAQEVFRYLDNPHNLEIAKELFRSAIEPQKKTGYGKLVAAAVLLASGAVFCTGLGSWALRSRRPEALPLPPTPAKVTTNTGLNKDKLEPPKAGNIAPVDPSDWATICYWAVKPQEDLLGCHTAILESEDFRKDPAKAQQLKTFIDVNNKQYRKGKAGCTIAGYLSVSEIAKWKLDKKPELQNSSMLQEKLPSGGRALDVMHDDWFPYMKSEVDAIKNAGFNAIFFDNLDRLLDQAQKNPAALKQIERLLEYCCQNGLSVITNKGFVPNSGPDTSLLKRWAKKGWIKCVVAETVSPEWLDALVELRREIPNLGIISVEFNHDRSPKAYLSACKKGVTPFYPSTGQETAFRTVERPSQEVINQGRGAGAGR